MEVIKIMLDLNHLYLMDCMDGMKEFPDKYFDLAIVDPPYGIGNWVQQTGNKRGNRVSWNESIPDRAYFDELERISEHRIIWGANYYNCFEGKNGAIIWDKNQPNPKFSKCEIASYSRLKRVDLVKIAWSPFDRKGLIIHECQKPVKLYKWILHNYANPDMKIIDTHVGSGSSIIAFLDFGCEWIGFEIDEDYHAAATKRIEVHQMQTKLF